MRGMGEVIQFPLERRRAQIAEEAGATETVEYVREPTWFGVRLRPEGYSSNLTWDYATGGWSPTGSSSA